MVVSSGDPESCEGGSLEKEGTLRSLHSRRGRASFSSQVSLPFSPLLRRLRQDGASPFLVYSLLSTIPTATDNPLHDTYHNPHKRHPRTRLNIHTDSSPLLRLDSSRFSLPGTSLPPNPTTRHFLSLPPHSLPRTDTHPHTSSTRRNANVRAHRCLEILRVSTFSTSTSRRVLGRPLSRRIPTFSCS